MSLTQCWVVCCTVRSVLGSKAFVDGVFEAQRDRFSPRRKTGAKRIRESEPPIYSLRQLRLRAVE